MTDLVERLREAFHLLDGTMSHAILFREAADEIERLKGALAESYRGRIPRSQTAEAEVERLRVTRDHGEQ